LRWPPRSAAPASVPPLETISVPLVETMAPLLRKQYDHYGRVVREANIKAE
jgi:hypothetical protein